MDAAYRFRSRWHLPAARAWCWSEIEHALLPGGDIAWWRGVGVTTPPERILPGESFVLAVRTPFRYRLRTLLLLDEVRPGESLSARAAGDLRGRGRVDLFDGPTPATTVVDFSWDVATAPRWMNVTAPLLRPVFARAHRIVMAEGERGLRRLLVGAP